jgi:hypothetical protein
VIAHFISAIAAMGLILAGAAVGLGLTFVLVWQHQTRLHKLREEERLLASHVQALKEQIAADEALLEHIQQASTQSEAKRNPLEAPIEQEQEQLAATSPGRAVFGTELDLKPKHRWRK